MNRNELQQFLDYCDKQGIFVLTYQDFRRKFNHESDKTLQASLARHTQSGLVAHPCRTIYLNLKAKSLDSYLLEHIAKALRRGEYSYISLESLLSEIGMISQVPLSRLTIMTTGRTQIYNTPYGDIEFTHTNKSIADIVEKTTAVPGRPLRLATLDTAVRDLKRVNRNAHLLINEEHNNDPQ